jgi:hypothetical protein
LGFKFLNFCNRYAISNNDRSTKSGDAAYFLGFDGLIAPGARWACLNLVLFTERLAPQSGTAGAATEIMWNAWRKRMLRRAELHKRFILPCSRDTERNQGAEL